MDDESMKTEIVRVSDALAERALAGDLRSVIVIAAGQDGRWNLNVIGQAPHLEIVGLFEAAKMAFIAQIPK
jgi:hypothetical protein